MSSIPPELHFDILLRLHPKDLLRCMCVSKSWCSLIRDKRFIKAQLEDSIEAKSFRTFVVFELHSSSYLRRVTNLYSLPFYHDDTFGTPTKIENPFEVEGHWHLGFIVGSSNGVVCINSRKWNGRDCHIDLAVWNPSIQKMKKVPSPTLDPPSSHQRKYQGPSFGFGYDSVNDDFKLVAIASFVNQDDDRIKVSLVKTYSLKSNSWKRIQNLPCIDFEFVGGMIVFCNGGLSLLMHNSHPLRRIGRYEFESRHIILTLDIATEEYHEFSIPFKYESSRLWVLGILGGCICTYVFDYVRPFDVWIMKEYGVVESWTLLCSIDVQHIRPFDGYCYQQRVSPKDGAMLLFMGKMHSFSWYDLEKKSFKHVEVQGLPARRFDQMTICCASLYLLDGDPVRREVLSTSKKRKLSSNASGNVEAIVDDQIREQQ